MVLWPRLRLRLRPRLQLPFTLVVALTACSCAWMGDPARENPDDCIRVVVENNSFADMNVFVERDGRLFRLGTVMSKRSEPFLLTHRMLGGATEYRLVADPVGSLEKVFTPPIKAYRDTVTHWMLEPTSWLSAVVFR